jgi:hypothetical protein
VSTTQTTTMPRRIQRKRTKGWRMPEGAVYVGRPTLWGNPFIVEAVRKSGPYDVLLDGEFRGQHTGIESARRSAVERFRAHLLTTEGRVGSGWVPTVAAIRAVLAGKDLVCWCPLDQPCHADVLLEIANGQP